MPTDEFLVLHGLRLKGVASSEALESAWAVDASSHLPKLAESGLCQFRDLPRGSGYLLLPEGRRRHAALVEEIRDGLSDDDRAALDHLYQRFGPLNHEFKALCTRWQMRGGVRNDHSDHLYDDKCVTELEELHARFLPLVRRAARVVGHFERYVARFRAVLERLSDEGDVDYFTGPLVDSYHTVWFELHEDLIAMTGRQRQAREA